MNIAINEVGFRARPRHAEVRMPVKAGMPIEEEHRKQVVRLIFLVYGLLLFEGVLRKWVLPHWGKPLFFVRDPFVILIYILVLTRRVKIRNPFLELGLLFAATELIFTLIRFFATPADSSSAVLLGYGWRNYFLNLPLAFVVARYMDWRDLDRLLRGTALVSAAMAVLVMVQFASPPSSPVNAGLGDTSDEIYASMLGPGGYVRTTGTFTASLGLTAFVASAVAMTISLWLAPSGARSVSSYLVLACGSGGPLVCLFLSGSRGAFLWAALVLVTGIFGLTLTRGEMLIKAGSITTLLVLFGLVAAPVLFPEAIASFSKRWSDAGETESRAYGSGGVFARALYEVFSFHLLLEDTPPEGYGLGFAGNAAWNLGTRNQVITFTSPEQVGAAESDWGRNILEMGPFFGTLFIFYRIAFALWLAWQTLASTVRTGQPLPWLLFAFEANLIFNGQITGNGTMNGYNWLFIGFCLAAVDQARPYPQLCNTAALMPLRLPAAPHIRVRTFRKQPC